MAMMNKAVENPQKVSVKITKKSKNSKISEG